MKQKNTNIFKFYVSNISIWWNKGLEAKPSFKWFNKSFEWEEITDTENFTVSWMDETHIKVIIPISKRNHLIRIENINLATNQYYFLVEELNRTSKNIEAIFQLDIWTSYIMNGEYLIDIRSTKNLDINGVSKFVPINKQGIGIGEWKKKVILFDTPMNEPFTFINRNQYSTPFNDTLLQSINNSYNKWYTHKYHVFKTQKTQWTDTSKDNYILIPEFLPEINKQLYQVYLKNEKLNQFIPAFIINSKTVIENVIENLKNLPTSGLGEYLGMWLGPNFFRLKSKTKTFKLENDYFNCSNVILLGRDNVPTLINMPELANFNYEDLYSELTFENIISRYPVINSKNYALFGIVVDEGIIDTYKVSFSKNDFVSGYTYLLNENNHLYNSNLFFNQCFNLSNEKDSTEINIQIPNSYDNYSNQVANQKDTLMTGQRANTANFVLNSAQSFVGGISDTATNLAVGNVSGALMGGVDSLFNFGKNMVQFVNTRRRYEAYLSDLRRQTSNTYTNYTDNYVFENYIVDNYEGVRYTDRIFNGGPDVRITKETIAGYILDSTKLTKFYGYDDIAKIVPKEFYKNNDCYIKIDELTKLELDLHLTKSFTPTIKEAIITLLNNGVRVVNNPENLDI